MKQKNINHQYILFGFSLILFAFLLLFIQYSLIIIVVQILAVGLIFHGIYQVLQYKTIKESNLNLSVIKAMIVIQILCGISLLYNWEYSPRIATDIIGIYQVIISLIGFYSFTLIIRDNNYHYWSLFMNNLFHFLLGIVGLIGPYRVEFTVIYFAIYLILLGVNYLLDSNLIPLAQQSFHFSNRLIRIPLPSIMVFGMPYYLLKKINAGFLGVSSKEILSPECSTDLEIFVHISPYGFDQLGHTDIAYQGKVYTFGNFDAETKRLNNLVGDGVMFITNRDKYFSFLKARRVTVISFRIKMTKQEQINLEHKLHELEQIIYPIEFTKSIQLEGYIKALYQLAEPQFYKFTSGIFQTYFVLGTNCVTFVDYLLCGSGLSMFAFASIMSPGLLLNNLRKEFNKVSSNVLSYKIYH